MESLGKLQKVEIRRVWEHEARDFSAWLAHPENLQILADEIGIDIELVGRETDVGRFRIDILGQEPNSGHKIIIENQLEATNHDHLGKVITYAAGLDAKYLVWIVADVLPEHLKAVEWLNEFLDDEINLFLIKIEVWQIGNSKPAPKFEIVSARNDWASNLKRTIAASEISETKLKQQKFWEGLAQYIKEHSPSFKSNKPAPQHWINFSMGTSISHIAATLNTRENRLAVELYISDNKEFFTLLKQNASPIEESLGGKFDWFDARKASGISLKKPVSDVLDESQWGAYYVWIFETVQKFKSVFSPYIDQFRNSTEG